MTKIEELKKYVKEIEKYVEELKKYTRELKEYTTNLDKEPELRHGDLVYLEKQLDIKRLVIDMRHIKRTSGYSDVDFILLDKNGVKVNGRDNLSDMISKYTKIRNIFED